MKKLYALLACLAVTPVANAEITATFVQDPATFGAGNNTYALQVTTDTDWQVSKIDIQLDSGSIRYRSDTFPPGPFPSFIGLGDSGVFGRDFAGPTFAPGVVITSTEFSAVWGTFDANDLGTFYIGAFTLSPDANGTVSGRMVARNPIDPINGLIYNLEGWSVVNGVMTHTAEPIPEPSTVVMVGLGLAGLAPALRRKQQRSLAGQSSCKENSR